MQMSIALAFHVLSVVVWVGGMFFAYMAMRPASAEVLDPPQRLTHWGATFKRFFFWVWISIALILVSGFWMFALFPKPPVYIHIMTTFGIIMMLIFGHVYFAGYRKLKKFVASEEWPEAAKALAQIRTLVGVNLIIGILTTVVATAGKYFI